MILSVKLNDDDKFGVNFQLLRDRTQHQASAGASPPTVAGRTSRFERRAEVRLPRQQPRRVPRRPGNDRRHQRHRHAAADGAEQAAGRNPDRQEEGLRQHHASPRPASTQSVEFLDTGTQLRLRPFISSDGLIRMEVHPELSDGDVERRRRLHAAQQGRHPGHDQHHGPRRLHRGHRRPDARATDDNTTTQIPLLGNLPLVGFAVPQQDRERPSATRCSC